MNSLILSDEAATARWGRLIADAVRPGDVLALIGDLGAGKTRLVQAIARGLGVADDAVNSPTFTLIHEYAGRWPIRHCDVYRLKHRSEFAELGLDELFAEDGIALIEWADRVRDDLPTDRLDIHLTATGETERTAMLNPTGPRSAKLVEAILRAYS
jgi:tRNA threonylcarbamoyladenosine biosynthesis protein TsaE